jgi:hypothetical protein
VDIAFSAHPDGLEEIVLSLGRFVIAVHTIRGLYVFNVFGTF